MSTTPEPATPNPWTETFSIKVLKSDILSIKDPKILQREKIGITSTPALGLSSEHEGLSEGLGRLLLPQTYFFSPYAQRVRANNQPQVQGNSTSYLSVEIYPKTGDHSLRTSSSSEPEPELILNVWNVTTKNEDDQVELSFSIQTSNPNFPELNKESFLKSAFLQEPGHHPLIGQDTLRLNGFSTEEIDQLIIARNLLHIAQHAEGEEGSAPHYGMLQEIENFLETKNPNSRLSQSFYKDSLVKASLYKFDTQEPLITLKKLKSTRLFSDSEIQAFYLSKKISNRDRLTDLDIEQIQLARTLYPNDRFERFKFVEKPSPLQVARARAFGEKSLSRSPFTSVLAAILNPITGLTFVLNYLEKGLNLYLNPPQIGNKFLFGLAFAAYVVVKPLQVLWTFLAEPLGRFTIYTGETLLENLRKRHFFLAALSLLGAVVSIGLPWISIGLSASFGPIVSILQAGARHLGPVGPWILKALSKIGIHAEPMVNRVLVSVGVGASSLFKNILSLTLSKAQSLFSKLSEKKPIKNLAREELSRENSQTTTTQESYMNSLEELDITKEKKLDIAEEKGPDNPQPTAFPISIPLSAAIRTPAPPPVRNSLGGESDGLTNTVIPDPDSSDNEANGSTASSRRGSAYSTATLSLEQTSTSSHTPMAGQSPTHPPESLEA